MLKKEALCISWQKSETSLLLSSQSPLLTYKPQRDDLGPEWLCFPGGLKFMGISEDIRDCIYSALSRMLERTEELFSNPEIKKLRNSLSCLLVLPPRLTVPVWIAFRHQGDLYFTIIHFNHLCLPVSHHRIFKSLEWRRKLRLRVWLATLNLNST